MFSLFSFTSVTIVAVALTIRWLVGQFPHSGQGTPPMYGDYEAQRHWMEITSHLPVRDWYRNTTDNDLLYWGLDYPPLTAYHMYILGLISRKFNSSWTKLHESRGTETHDHKVYMRSTVILSDLLIYMPAVLYYFYKTRPSNKSPQAGSNERSVATYVAFALFYPGQILIDHGHFQYNCVFMGMVVWAVIFMSKGKQATSALIFTLALSYKQMSLYYSLPFFWYIASSNIRVKPVWKGIRNIILVSIVVSMTFGFIFSPFISDKEIILQVLKRLFPFDRGLFEDKVANFWFCLSIFYKYRKFSSTEDLLRASTLLTSLLSLPAGLHLLFKPRMRTFKYALVNTALVFFLLSFQVHEKTILLPALPILLLFREHPLAVNWFAIMSTFSLQPLLSKDGQMVPYSVLMIVYTLLSMEIFKWHFTTALSRPVAPNVPLIMCWASILGCFALNLVALFMKPPPHLPDLHPTVNALYSFVHFVGFLFFFYYRQFRESKHNRPTVQVPSITKKTN